MSLALIELGSITYRKIAVWHGLSVGMVHYLAADVQMVLLTPWHRARLPKDAPLPPLVQVHRLLRVA
jgi:hypothetical protein